MKRINFSLEEYRRMSYGLRRSVKPALISYITVCVLYVLGAFVLHYSAKDLFNITFLTTLSSLFCYLFLSYFSNRFAKYVDIGDLKKIRRAYISYLIVLVIITAETVVLAYVTYLYVNM